MSNIPIKFEMDVLRARIQIYKFIIGCLVAALLIILIIAMTCSV